MADALTLADVGEQSLPAARTFLETHVETSLFLLSNIRAFGTRLGESLYSGNVKCFRDNSGIKAVFCLTRGGSLLAQTAGDARLAHPILEAVRAEHIPVRGVLGEWTITRAICDELQRAGWRPSLASKEILYRLTLSHARLRGDRNTTVKLLTGEDEVQWEELTTAFVKEERLPLQGTEEQRKAAFLRSCRLNHWWGAWDGDLIVSLAGITALHERTAQLGGVFTRPAYRRRGLNRAVLERLITDARDHQGLSRLFLFTGEDNVAARQMYESLGFERFGYFGLFFGD